MSKIQLKTYLPVFKRNWAYKNWSGVFSLNGLPLSDELAHAFVDRAIAEGYEYDADVPDEKVLEWIGLEAACKQPVTDCNHLGNAAKMREALMALIGVIDKYDSGNQLWWNSGAKGVMPLKDARSALSAPPRNCDVGTSGEQEKRFNEYCENSSCSCCPLRASSMCEFA